MATASLTPQSAAIEGKVIYDSDPYNDGWIVAAFGESEDASVGIRWKAGRPRPGVVSLEARRKSEWFFVPKELAGAVLEAAKRLEAEREEGILRGYQEMAADTEQENEAFEWIEAHVGECL